MGSNVLQLIERAAPKRKQASNSDIVALASGSSTASPTTKRRRTTSGSTRSKASSSSSGSKKTPKAKPPCKYGPRGSDGYCPKKPASTRSTKRNPTRVTAKTAEGATEQAIRVLTNPNATASQKSTAVTQVGATIVSDAARKTARKNAPKIKEALKKVTPIALPVAVGAGVAVAGGKALTANRKREARAFAARELAKTKKRLPKGQRLTPDQEATLRQQYYDFAVKRPVTNSFSGK